MKTAWAHIHNAAHIDRVLADVIRRPKAWGAARSAALSAAWVAAWDEAWKTSGGAAPDAAAWSAARKVSEDAARDAIAALIAWDDSAELLALDPDAVRLLAASGHHPAVLLLPACIVFTAKEII